MKKQTKMTQAINESDWRQKIFDRENGICQWCGGPASDPCHIIPRVYKKTRLLVENGLCLCRPDHNDFDKKKDFRDKLIRILVTQEKYFHLRNIAEGKE